MFFYTFNITLPKTLPMKKLSLSLLIMTILCFNSLFAQVSFIKQPQIVIGEASQIAYFGNEKLPCYIKFDTGKEILFKEWQSWISGAIKISDDFGFEYVNTEKGENEAHYRYIQTYHNIPIEGNTIIIHVKNDKVYAINGRLTGEINSAPVPSLSETDALNYALSYINATTYKWQLPEEERLLKQIKSDENATYYPKGELYYIKDKTRNNLVLAYRFDIYANEPLSRNYVYVDALSGKVIAKVNRIRTTDTPGVAHTKYSGTQDIVTDSYSSQYRLREADRGNGIETYNLQTGTNYGSAVDFLDDDNDWNNVNTAQDEVATDAHWATEMTYDYYYDVFGRNSLDNAGMKLLSYVHYDVDYYNAFWDGERMTYGDGNSSVGPLTTLDICGHEITHGVDEKTANLIYSDESGALNEGYSDIFGTCIERFARPSNWDWLVGADIGSIFRDMSNPNAYGQPDTYLGTNWDPAAEVHTNSGVLAYWFYLASEGGTGTNDNGDNYSVTGISVDSAAAVAYRALTVYLPSSATYADARFYSILAATDIFGACTPQVESVTNAWYAVGVGGPYVAEVVSDFTVSDTALCTVPSTVHFTNLSGNAGNFLWDFGDGTTSIDMNPDHTYTTYGLFTVKLVAYGGACGNDSLTKTDYINVSALNPCIVIIPQNSTGETQTACNGKMYDSGGTSNYQDNTNGKITISPDTASSITLSFVSFNFENNYDFLYIYDGPSDASPLIGAFTGTSLPNGGTITSSTGSVTLVQTTDQGVNRSGFELNWSCNYPTAPPIVNFISKDTNSCTGDVSFNDLSINGPTSWNWDFGDGGSSTLQNPAHTYVSNGVYDVKLVCTNSFGSDSATKIAYINVNMPAAPTVLPASRCDSGTVTLSASGGTIYNWYDSAMDGNLLYTGSDFTTPFLGANTTYYVENNTGSSVHNVGPLDNSIGGGGYYTNSSYHYLKFNANVPLKLNSVQVFCDQAGTRTIELTNSAGTVLQDTSIDIPSGPSRLTLNFDLPVANGLRLGVDGQNHLWRNNQGGAYPYSVPGIISITGNSANNGAYYYYFYDWEVEEVGCSSARVPVEAKILLPSAEVSPAGPIDLCSGQNVTLTAQSAESYLWTPTNETTQSIIVGSSGSYTVEITDSACTALSVPVIVTESAGMPIAGFTYTNNDPTISFTDTSVAAFEYSWDFGDGNYSVLQNPSHTYTTNGNYEVTLIVTNSCGTDTISKNIIIDNAALKEYQNGNNCLLYPNPAKNNVFISIGDQSSKITMIKIMDLIGNTVSIEKLYDKTAEINTASLPRGMYFVEITTPQFKIIKKLMLN